MDEKTLLQGNFYDHIIKNRCSWKTSLIEKKSLLMEKFLQKGKTFAQLEGKLP